MGKSHQKGWIVPRGKKWYGYFRRTVVDAVSGEPKTIAVPLVLGARSQMTKFEARDAMERLQAQKRRSAAVSLGRFTERWRTPI